MSTISEIDIRDWDNIPLSQFKANPHGVRPMVDYWKVLEFVKAVALLREKQIKQATKHIPAIFKKGEE
jgi:hypothetical protein